MDREILILIQPRWRRGTARDPQRAMGFKGVSFIEGPAKKKK